MNTLTIDNIEYVLSDYILKNAPIYSKGSRSTRDLMKRKKISENDYVYMKIKDDKYIKSNGKSNRDKIFVKKSIIDIIPELNNKKGITDDGIEEAPEIIKLKDSEKFFDNKGKPLEIETRGERTEEGIYFKVKDVEKAFDIKRLDKKLITENTNYQLNTDYKYFICKNVHNVDKSPNKEMYLTYEGMLRVLYVSRNNKTTSFRKWATKSLFTLQMGTKEQKKELFDKILGTDLESSRNVIKSNNNKLSAIYLLTLGYVKDLKHEMKLDSKFDDNMIVCKYGRSDDLSRRLYEHKKTFKSIKTSNPMLKLHCYIDGNYASQAETQIKNYFNGANKNLVYEGFDELVIIDKEFLKYTEEQYKLIASNYIGTQHDSIFIIKNMENQFQLEIKDYQYKLLEKEGQLKEKEGELKVSLRDNEILELKLKLCKLQQNN